MNCPACGVANLDGADECDSCKSSLTDPALHLKSTGLEARFLTDAVAALSPRPAISVGGSAAVADAVAEMRARKVGCVLIIDGGRLKGVLSERELLFKTAQKASLKGLTAKQIMRDAPVCLNEDDPIADVFHQMAISGHRHLPVRTRAGRYCVVSSRDLLRYLSS